MEPETCWKSVLYSWIRL